MRKVNRKYNKNQTDKSFSRRDKITTFLHTEKNQQHNSRKSRNKATFTAQESTFLVGLLLVNETIGHAVSALKKASSSIASVNNRQSDNFFRYCISPKTLYFLFFIFVFLSQISSVEAAEMSGLIPLRVVHSNDMFCEEKLVGVNVGKICTIFNESNFLKVAFELSRNRFNSDIFVGYFNLILMGTLNMKVPSLSWIYEPNGRCVVEEATVFANLFLASKAIDNFTSANHLVADISSQCEKYCKNRSVNSSELFHSLNYQSYFRKLLLEKIGGEYGLAQLAVAGTFSYDVVDNDGNWGSDGERLVIVDMDSSPATLRGYFQLAGLMSLDIPFQFSLLTLSNMITLFSDALTLFDTQHSFTISSDERKILLSALIQACKNTIINCQKEFPNESVADKRINEALSAQIQQEHLSFAPDITSLGI